MYSSLLSNFSLLEKLNQIYTEALGFDNRIKGILKNLNIYSGSQGDSKKEQGLQFEDLLELEIKGSLIRIKLDSFRDFLIFLQTVKISIDQCESYLKAHTSEEVGFKVSNLQDF